MMTDTLNEPLPLSRVERYLPFVYPILMPLLTLNAFKIPVSSVRDVLSYLLFTGFVQFIMILVIRNIVYSTAYYQVVRWLLAALACLSIVITIVFIEYKFVHLTTKFANPNPWITILRISMNIVILISLLESFKAFRERSKFNTHNVKLHSENVKAQFNLLLQQINPHFLFNSLTTLQAMVRSKDKQTEEFIIRLKEVYQQTLKKEKGTVTLQEELDFFNSYMYLITLRQGRAVVLDVNIADESLAYHIPTYTLQLLAENCIKHNIASELKPLSIRLYQKDPKSVTVANNYQPKQIKAESFGIGIDNLKKRYALAGIENGVVIKQDETTYETTIKLF
jgi:two-component system LytT family sensor kinase